MLVERSRKFWSLVDQSELRMHKFYDDGPKLNQVWFGQVSRLQCFAEITQHALTKRAG